MAQSPFSIRTYPKITSCPTLVLACLDRIGDDAPDGCVAAVFQRPGRNQLASGLAYGRAVSWTQVFALTWGDRVYRILRRCCMIACFGLLLAGCAAWPRHTPSIHLGAEGQLGACAELFHTIDTHVARSGSADAGFMRIQHYPYLRADRFTASLRDQIAKDEQFDAWVDRMQALDLYARIIEMANRGSTEGDHDMMQRLGNESVAERIRTCGDLLQTHDFADRESRQRLIQSVHVPDDYLFYRQFFGLYPLARPFVAHGVSEWHAEARRNFSNQPPADRSDRQYYAPVIAAQPAIQKSLAAVDRDALGIPQIDASTQRVLFSRFAPLWDIAQQADHDRPGTPHWDSDDVITVDVSQPRVYTYLSFTRFAGAVLPQLNYMVWFSQRPKRGPLDIYGGRLDGVLLRITLSQEDAPLLYETIHPCGCYYKAFPTDRLSLRADMGYREPPLILSAPAENGPDTALVVALESGTHYVTNLYAIPRSTVRYARTYALADYDDLLQLPTASGGSRSMFGRNGLVQGSQRLERFILWPTGVLSPGAMRQRGRHAVAFVGRRHFDDPDALDRMFLLRQTAPE